MRYVVAMMPRATRQLNAIAVWWRANRPEAPQLATDEVLAAVASLDRSPSRGIPIPGAEHLRMLVTRRTRLLIVYRIRPQLRRVEILRIKRP